MKKYLILLGVLAGVAAHFVGENSIDFETLRLRGMLGWKEEQKGFFTKKNKKFAIAEADPNTILKEAVKDEGEHYNNDYPGILVRKGENLFAYYLLDNVNWKGYKFAFSGMSKAEVSLIVKSVNYKK